MRGVCVRDINDGADVIARPGVPCQRGESIGERGSNRIFTVAISDRPRSLRGGVEVSPQFVRISAFAAGGFSTLQGKAMTGISVIRR